MDDCFRLGGLIGLDPHPFSLRELFQMAAAKWERVGELAAWHVASVAAMLGGQVDPVEINPYRVVTEAERKARAEAEKKRFWASLGVQLAGDSKVFEKLTIPPVE